MRKILYIATILLLQSLNIQGQQNQNTSLFRFVTHNEISGDKHVLFHNLENNQAVTKKISADTFNATSGYLESFILQPAGNKGEVYIVSAKAPEYFLKAGNNDFEPVNFARKTAEDNDDDYKWFVTVGSNDRALVVIRAFSGFGLAYQTQSSGQRVMYSAFRDAATLSFRPLLNNSFSDDPVHFHNTHLFTMESIKNVF